MLTLGFDTSNYTTSVCIYDSESGRMHQKKLLLPVKDGEKGLRQSDAVFHHTARLYPLVRELFEEVEGEIVATLMNQKMEEKFVSYLDELVKNYQIVFYFA